MREKIFAALKTACGQTTSISDKTLDKIAETLTPTITEESQIEAAIELQKPILQAIDGNINHVAAEAVKKVKPEKLEKQADPEDPKKGPGRPRKETDDEIPEWAKKLQADNADLKARLESQENEKQSAMLIDKVKNHEKLKGIPASFLKGRNLTPKSEAEIDQLVDTLNGDYTGFKAEMAEQGIVISIPPTGKGSSGDEGLAGKKIAEMKNAAAKSGGEGKKV